MTNDPLIKHYTKDEETGEMVPVRIMDVAEILERENLRIANTSEKMRNRVLEHEARQIAKTALGNGHSHFDPLDPPTTSRIDSDTNR